MDSAKNVICRYGRSLWLLLALLACVCLAFTSVCSLAFARTSSKDDAVTRTYLRASDVFERDVHAELGVSIAAIEERAKRIAAECPLALTYAPRDTAFEELGYEASFTLLLAGEAPVRSPALALARAIGHLLWSNPKLTHLVHGLALEERELTSILPPDFCAEIAAWKASAYVALPAGAQKFVMQVTMLESSATGGPSEESEATIMHLLRRYEDPAERQAAARIERLEALIEKRFDAAVIDAQARLASALGVPAL